MSKSFKDLNSLFAEIEKKVTNSLDKEVKEQGKQTLKENVITEVYEAYTPTSYERTGGLYQDSNIEAKVDGNKLTISSTRSENGRDIGEVIEYGQGYYSPELDTRIGSRPYHEKTAMELEEKGLAEKALVKGLKRQGINVK